MDGKGRIYSRILKSIAMTMCLLMNGCIEKDTRADIEIEVRASGMQTKAFLPDEEKVSDINLLVYDSRGCLEYNIFSASRSCRMKLLKGERYTFCALINFGYKIVYKTLEDLKGHYHHLAYPDEYREGIPMYAILEGHMVGDDGRITLEASRLMSRITLRMDRSRLSAGTEMNVTAVRIGNCPKKVRVFASSRAEVEDDCFSSGFSHSGSECSALNTENSRRLSGSISLYMLENMQGRFSDRPLDRDEEKVFEEYDIRNRICSYIEIEMDYSSPVWISDGGPLKYRFYLGGGRDDLDIERNCHYRITICPEDDGLTENGWRVDKTCLKYTGHASLTQYPKDYITGDIGDRIHIGCILTPDNAPFDVGEEYMKADKAEGIYDYVIDADGRGATLTLTGPGRGLIYMEAGPPVNDAALFMIEVNKP